MKNLLDKAAMIKLKEKGMSNRTVAKTLGVDKKTVNKYWNEYQNNLQKLKDTTNVFEITKIQEEITSAPKYNSVGRVTRKVTPEFLIVLDEILKCEEEKKYIGYK